MKYYFLFLFLSFPTHVFALTVVAKVDAHGFLHLEENDPHRNVIVDILMKYQWPVSLMECTDEERYEIFKDNIPFAETVFIQKKVREVTGDNTYVALWIPPLVSQMYVIYLQQEGKMFSDELLKSEEILTSRFFLPDLCEKEVCTQSYYEKDYYAKKKDYYAQFRKANSLVNRVNESEGAFRWFYMRNLLDFSRIKYNPYSLCLNFDDAQNLFKKIFPLSLRDDQKYLQEHVRKYLDFAAMLAKEYESARKNCALFSRGSEPFFVENPTLDKVSRSMQVAWSPFHEENILYSMSFAIRHLDGFYYDKSACSFWWGTSYPLFYFNASLKENEHILYSRGLIIPLTDELIAPLLEGEFFHGRMAMSNELLDQYKNLPVYEMNRRSTIGIPASLDNAQMKYYMMQANSRLPFDKDTELQKLFYAMVTSSFVAATFDIINIKPEKGARIKENQKKLAVYYRILFLNHIKKLASKVVETSPSFKPTVSFSSPDRISMIAGHVGGYKKNVLSSPVPRAVKDIEIPQKFPQKKEERKSFSFSSLWQWLVAKWRR